MHDVFVLLSIYIQCYLWAALLSLWVDDLHCAKVTWLTSLNNCNLILKSILWVVCLPLCHMLLNLQGSIQCAQVSLVFITILPKFARKVFKQCASSPAQRWDILAGATQRWDILVAKNLRIIKLPLPKDGTSWQVAAQRWDILAARSCYTLIHMCCASFLAADTWLCQ